MLLVGDWVVPVSSSPLSNGAVLIEGGKIIEVGPATGLRARYPHEEVREYPGCALLPGFVNAHTHLDYSAFRGFRPSHGFMRWIIRLTRARMRLDSDDLAVSARWGARECLRFGVTSIADTSYGGTTVARAAEEVGLRARVYLEVFGLDDARLGETMTRLEMALQETGDKSAPDDRPRGVAALDEGGPDEGEPYEGERSGDALGGGAKSARVEWGISPHAPYTVSQELYREVARLAREHGLRMATHLAESKTESRLLRRGAGVIALIYRTLSFFLGGRWKLPSVSPLEHVDGAGALGPDMLVVHAVQLDEDEVTALARSGSPVVHCPRSNLKLGCGLAPVAEMRKAEIVVALGTDSLASNDDLDMLAEMRTALEVSSRRGARRGAQALLPSEVLRMATLDGAQALGWETVAGSLEAGKSADLAVVRLPAEVHPDSPGEHLARAVMDGEVRATFVRGQSGYDGSGTEIAVIRELAAVREKIGLRG